MVVFKYSLEWPPQPKISTCKLSQDSYICSPFNYFNHSAASNMQQLKNAGKIDPWSEAVSAPQSCASDSVSVCEMKVASCSHRDSLSRLRHKGLGSECLLPTEMFESERRQIISDILRENSFEPLCYWNPWGGGATLWPFSLQSVAPLLFKCWLWKWWLKNVLTFCCATACKL